LGSEKGLCFNFCTTNNSLLAWTHELNSTKTSSFFHRFNAGMYGHLKGLTRMGTGTADIPTGSSMAVDIGGRNNGTPAAASGWGAKGGDLMKSGPSAIADAARENSRATASVTGGKVGTNSNVHGFANTSSLEASRKVSGGSGAPSLGGDGAPPMGMSTAAFTGGKVGTNSNVHGFSSGGSSKPSIHAHADSFQRSKGVVNTLGGAKDTTRAEKMEAPRLPPKGQGKAQIMGFSTLDAHTVEGKARREAAEKREKAGGNTHGMKLVHVSGGGGRVPPPNGPAVVHTLAGDKKERPSARYGGLQPTMGVAPTKEIRASRVVSSAPEEVKSRGIVGGGGVGTLGGGKALSANSLSDREKRAAYFEKKEAEDKARRAAVAANAED